ncbi:hypothetical protein EF87_19935 [Bacillus amyloliquefaciens]|nr:hypothetical protein EF87_19935 [Bacillus amyloliquefaciens]
MLEGKDILKNIETLQENHHSALKEYKDGLVELRDHLKKTFFMKTISWTVFWKLHKRRLFSHRMEKPIRI